MAHAPITQSPDWQVERLDLDAYLARIGYDGRREPTIASLEALYRGHHAAIPFENVTALLGDHVPLDLDALQAKMVEHRRGGYCHEHVMLFGAALERLRFPVTRLAARVRPRAPRVLPRTHLLLATEVAGDRLICDIGFGAGVLGPLPLTSSTTRQGGWDYRLEPHGPEWLLSGRGTGPWEDLHVFTEAPQVPADIEMANHFVATSPHSPFARRLIVMRVDERVRRTLLDRTLITEYADGHRDAREVTTADALTVLWEVFDVHLDADDEARLRRHLDGTSRATAPDADAPSHPHDPHDREEVTADVL